MKNVLLTIEYDGSNFNGWQRQPKGRAVQNEIEKALSQLCEQPIAVHGTSRTDGKVHALEQAASFQGEFAIPIERIAIASKRFLPDDIRIKSATEVPPDFHARYSATGKRYLYKIHTGKEGSVFLRNYVYSVKGNLDVNAMKQAAKFLEGTHDFKTFMAAGSTAKDNTIRTINSLKLIDDNKGMLTMEVIGDGFLYKMVRIIAGTLIDVGIGKKHAKDMDQIIKSKDRNQARHTAPPQGLYLANVFFK